VEGGGMKNIRGASPIVWLAILLLGWLVMALPVQAASFDCAKASTKVEKLICDIPAISKLDDELGKVYQDDISKANEEQKQRLVAEQKHWLKYTRNVCTKEPCFKHAYWSRLAELKTFFDPHSPLYEKESDKAEAIKQVLATTPFYELEYSPNVPFCRQLFDDLKQMKDVHFVDPVVQTQSYEDPALDPWKQQCKGDQPIHFSYVCDGRISVLYAESIPEDMKSLSAVCGVGYGLPPFKLFELLPLQPSGEKHYVFYSDDDYGPMNQDWSEPHAGGGSKAGFDKLVFPSCKHRGSLTRARGGARNAPNYNSVISYRGQYYLVDLYSEYADKSYRLSIEPVIQKPISVCNWSPVKHKTSNQGSK
jgi:uncharacterized protein